MLSCREVTSLATEYTEGGLPWTTWLHVRLHLVMCWMCRRYYRQLALTSQVLQRLSGREGPERPPESLRQAFRQWKAEGPSHPHDRHS